MGGYIVDLDRSRLEGAPSYKADEDPWSDGEDGRSIYDHYGLAYPY